jgi:two-component system, response regulator PdtaR
VSHSSFKKLLIVEDDPMLLNLLEDLLDNEEYDAVFANTSDAALRQLDENGSFDVLMTDVKLPGKMDGVELAHEAITRYENIKVIIMTGLDISSLDRISDPRQFMVLQKPYSLLQVLSTIETMVQK